MSNQVTAKACVLGMLSLAMTALAPEVIGKVPTACRYSPVQVVAESPDGALVAADNSLCLWVWDAKSGKDLFVRHYERDDVISSGRRMAFSPQGDLIAVAPNAGVLILDSRTGKQTQLIDPFTDGVTSRRPVQALAFSPDGKRIAVALWEGVTAVYELSTGKLDQTFANQSPGDQPRPFSVSFSPDGKRIATGGLFNARRGDFLEVADAATGTLVFGIDDFSHTVDAVSFSPDGTMVLAVEYQGQPRVYDSATGQLVSVLQQRCPGYGNGFDGYGRFGTFIKDGTQIVCACDLGAVEVCQVSDGSCTMLIELESTDISAMSTGAARNDLLFLEISSAGPEVVRREERTGTVIKKYKFQ